MSGRCIHFPYSSVTHEWGRGNYRKSLAYACQLNQHIQVFCQVGSKDFDALRLRCYNCYI